MRKHRFFIALLAIAISAVPAIPQEVQNEKAPEASSARRAAAIALLRTINTMEIVYESAHGGFADWNTLLDDEDFASSVTRILTRLDPQLAGTLVSRGPDIWPEWKLRLNVHADRQGYDVFLRDTSDANKHYGAMTNEVAVIWECKTI